MDSKISRQIIQFTYTNFKEIIMGINWQGKRVLELKIYNWKSVINTANMSNINN